MIDPAYDPSLEIRRKTLDELCHLIDLLDAGGLTPNEAWVGLNTLARTTRGLVPSNVSDMIDAAIVETFDPEGQLCREDRHMLLGDDSFIYISRDVYTGEIRVVEGETVITRDARGNPQASDPRNSSLRHATRMIESAKRRGYVEITTRETK